MFGPMWDPQVSVAGLPAQFFVLATGLLTSTIGILWIRRILNPEGEVQSFMATADRPGGPGWIGILGLALIGFLIVLAAIYLATQDTPPDGSILDSVVLGGGVLAGSAVVLAVRRVWYRFR